MISYRLITHDLDNCKVEVGIASNRKEDLRELAKKIIAYAQKNKQNKKCEIVSIELTIQ